jgi:N-acetylmuramoyl-L-alanine amidase
MDANDWGADLFVSIHFNAGGGDGYEAFVYGQNREPLGRMFEKYVKQAGQNSRGVKYRPGLAVLKNTKMPAVLNESAFVDNLKDIQDWNEDAELKALGVAYAKAAAEFLGLEKKIVADNKIYYVQVFAGSKAGAENALKLAKERGFTDAFIK